MKKNNSIDFILASSSERRRTLLAEAGYKFHIAVSGIDESAFSVVGVSPAEYAGKLAMAKAQDVARRFTDNIIVAADTVIDFDGEIIGKVDNAKQAEEILTKLFSRPHKVITAIALVHDRKDKFLLEYDSTTVYPGKLNHEQIKEYIASGLWIGRAGAYGIREGADPFIDRIEGSETNVMGFSMELFEKMYRKFAAGI